MKDYPNRCPLAAVDQRLDDAHRQWHQAEGAYFEPEAFRVAIQSTIQTLRTVTFLVQSNKRLIPEFDDWYARWQEDMRADPLMRWMVEARNKIEKVGDLEVHSLIRAEIIASYLDEGPRVEVPAKLFDGTKQLLESVPDGAVGEHVRKHGILAIQRRWVENTLPDFELLDAVATAYGRLSNLVADAHKQAGLPPPETTNRTSKETFAAGFREGRLPCMIGHADTRTLNISLADGARMTVEAHEEPFDIAKAEAAAAKFGVAPDAIFPRSASSAEDVLNSLFDTARTVFLKDDYHQTIAFFLKDAHPIHIEALHPEDQAQKYLMMRQVANEVRRRGADAVILLAEAWTAKFDPSDPYRRAGDAPDREEILSATLVQSVGDAIQLSAQIKRKAAKIRIAGTVRVRSPAVWNFAPVYQVWGRPLPDEWEAALRGAPRG